jgi:hypothetical protein
MLKDYANILVFKLVWVFAKLLIVFSPGTMKFLFKLFFSVNYHYVSCVLYYKFCGFFFSASFLCACFIHVSGLCISLSDMSICLMAHRHIIQSDLGGVTTTYRAHFWRHFEQKVSYKPWTYAQYLHSYIRVWKRTATNWVFPSLM